MSALPLSQALRLGSAAAILVLSGLLTVRGHAQEEAERVRPEPALQMGPETRARWIEYVQRRIPQLRAAGRLDAEIEEWLVLSTLEGDTVGPLERAILTAVEMADQSGEAFGERNLPTLLARRTADELTEKHGKRSPAVAYAYGRMKFTQGDFEGAHDFFRYALELELDPAIGGIWLIRAAAAQTFRQVQAGKGREAILDLTFALEFCEPLEGIEDQYRLLARLSLSRAHRTENEHPVAERVTLAVIDEFGPTASKSNLARMRYELGMVFFESGRTTEAIEALEQVLALISPKHPTYGDAVFTLTEAYTECAPPRYDEAYRLITEMIEREGRLTALLFRLGKVEFDRGNLAEARQALEAAQDFGVPALVLLIRICSEIGTEESLRSAERYTDMLEHVQRTNAEGAPKEAPEVSEPTKPPSSD